MADIWDFVRAKQARSPRSSRAKKTDGRKISRRRRRSCSPRDAKNGPAVVSRLPLAAAGADGSFTFNRQDNDVGAVKPGEYIAQLYVVRADGTKAFLPTAGIPVTIRPALA
jgi:hypothetical protein